MSNCHPICPTETIVDPPVRVFRDVCHRQIIRVIHPIEIVTRHHCVPVFQHVRVVREVEEESCEVNAQSTPRNSSGRKGRIARVNSKSKNKSKKSKLNK